MRSARAASSATSHRRRPTQTQLIQAPRDQGLDGGPAPRILGQVRGNRAYAALFVSAHTGMRRGEILGLRWATCTSRRHGYRSARALISVAHEMQLSDVKTGAARRTIDLDERTLIVLRQWRKAHAEEKLLLGSRYQTSRLIDCGGGTEPSAGTTNLRESRITRRGKVRVTRQDLACRHTFGAQGPVHRVRLA